MAKRGTLSEFQAYLANRLAGADERAAAGLLGVLSGAEHWLLKLSDSGEVVSLSELTSVPLTRPWFLGIANIRGNLYSVADFSAFQGKEATPQNTSSRLLLIGMRHGNNTALLVSRMLGLHNIDDLTPVPADDGAPIWAKQIYTDREGRRWRLLDVEKLLADERFMDIGI